MPGPRRFRFAGSAYATATGSEFVEAARRVESLGYDTLLLPDHFEQEWFAVGPALAAVAAATSTLRVGSVVYSNNFRHPALLAREAATVDVLSDGRMEVGIGAGYEQPEYAQTGIHLPAPAERVERLRESLTIIKGLWGQDPLTHAGTYYTITDMEGWPKPLQQPHPPIQVGGGGRRMLTLAAQQADIVGIIARSAVSGQRSAVSGQRSAAASSSAKTRTRWSRTRWRGSAKPPVPGSTNSSSPH